MPRPFRGGSRVRGRPGTALGTPESVEKLRGTDLHRGRSGATLKVQTPSWPVVAAGASWSRPLRVLTRMCIGHVDGALAAHSAKQRERTRIG